MRMNSNNQKLYISVKDASNQLAVSKSKLNKLINEGEFPNCFINSTREGYRIPVTDIEAYIEKIKKLEEAQKDFLSISQMAKIIECK